QALAGRVGDGSDLVGGVALVLPGDGLAGLDVLRRRLEGELLGDHLGTGVDRGGGGRRGRRRLIAGGRRLRARAAGAEQAQRGGEPCGRGDPSCGVCPHRPPLRSGRSRWITSLSQILPQRAVEATAGVSRSGPNGGGAGAAGGGGARTAAGLGGGRGLGG